MVHLGVGVAGGLQEATGGRGGLGVGGGRHHGRACDLLILSCLCPSSTRSGRRTRLGGGAERLHHFLTRVEGCGVEAIEQEELCSLTEGGLSLEEGLPKVLDIGCTGACR